MTELTYHVFPSKVASDTYDGTSSNVIDEGTITFAGSRRNYITWPCTKKDVIEEITRLSAKLIIGNDNICDECIEEIANFIQLWGILRGRENEDSVVVWVDADS